ncbi:AAA family ATPase [candidate division KSB1 bacterium]|nr:AAA family ATPase [candidate division KSB1 bacterium]
MYREIDTELLNWKDRENRKPLIVRGARQVGKTHSIEKFARLHFANFIKINFEEQIELKPLFKNFDIDRILNDLSILFSTMISPGRTLIFLDEIQACPEAIVSLRYFYEKRPSLHVIAAGSLLDFTLKEMNYAMPVGRVEFCYMYPMSFKEFLLALSQDRLVSYIQNYELHQDFSQVIHQKILDYLRMYLFVGGMPEAVKTCLTQKPPEVERIHSNILTALQFDFAKYGTKQQQEHLLSVFRYCARNVGKKVKYANIDREVRSENLKQAFQRLQSSRLLHLVHHTNASRIPLMNGVKENIYKPLFLDIGLANHLSGIRLIELENILTNNEGALAEQFIGQELLTLTPPYMDSKLYYWTREERNANAEVDYVFQWNNSLIPVEVKAGKTGSLKSLHVYLLEKRLNTAIRFNLDKPSIGTFQTKTSTGKIQTEIEFQLLSLPLYMCFQLPEIINAQGLAG